MGIREDLRSLSKSKPKKLKHQGYLIPLNLLKVVQGLPCRVCEEPPPSEFCEVECLDGITGDPILYYLALCSLHAFELRHTGLLPFSTHHRLDCFQFEPDSLVVLIPEHLRDAGHTPPSMAFRWRPKHRS